MSLEKEENKQTTVSSSAKKTAVPKTNAVEETTAPKTYSTEEIRQMMQTPEAQAFMQEIVKKMLADREPTVVQVKSNEEMVTLLYMGAVREGSFVELDGLGQIMGRGGMIDVPKKTFLQNLTAKILKRLKDRRLLVINGLTDEERERYGLKYEDGEIVDRNIYYDLLSMDEQRVATIFQRACYRHKQLIASLYADAYCNHDNRVNQPLIKKLNEISKSTDSDGMFTAILKDMGKALAE